MSPDVWQVIIFSILGVIGGSVVEGFSAWRIRNGAAGTYRKGRMALYLAIVLLCWGVVLPWFESRSIDSSVFWTFAGTSSVAVFLWISHRIGFHTSSD
jgi:hypothetical protein